MDDTSHATDRLVVVGSGFGVWINNRHIASGRWGDVMEVRASKHDKSPSDHVNLVVLLRDGTEVSIKDNLFGYQSFLAAAEALLPGMSHQSEWLPAMLNAELPSNGEPAETMLFRRRGLRK